MTPEEAINRAVKQFNTGENDIEDLVLDFLCNLAWESREVYIKLYATRILQEASTQSVVNDEPFKTIGEIIHDETSTI